MIIHAPSWYHIGCGGHPNHYQDGMWECLRCKRCWLVEDFPLYLAGVVFTTQLQAPTKRFKERR